MKKIISLLLIAGMLLSLASCGAINKDGEVSVLWSDLGDEYLFTISDALDRAMYIEKIDYTHYDAKKNSATQIEQASAAIQSGAVALVVNPVDLVAANAILALAKEARLPLVFLCADLPATLVESYDKCASVNVDATTLYTVLGEKIAEDLIESYDAYDRNGDGKISYAAFGISAMAVPTVNEKLAEAGKPALVADLLHATLPTIEIDKTVDSLFEGYDGSGDEVNATPVELILTDDDAYVDDLLLALRKYELNHEKLVTHFIPLYTVGNAANAGALLDSKNEEELAAYSVMNAIDDGFLSAAALEDDDAIALAAAAIVRNLILGNEILADVEGASDVTVLIPYTVYAAD